MLVAQRNWLDSGGSIVPNAAMRKSPAGEIMSDYNECSTVPEDVEPAKTGSCAHRSAGFILLKRYEGLSIRIGGEDGEGIADLPLTGKDALNLASSIQQFYTDNSSE